MRSLRSPAYSLVDLYRWVFSWLGKRLGTLNASPTIPADSTDYLAAVVAFALHLSLSRLLLFCRRPALTSVDDPATAVAAIDGVAAIVSNTVSLEW